MLAENNPTLATWTDIGDSWEKSDGGLGYDIKVLRLTNQAISGPKPVLFAMAAIHAREYTTAELVTRFGEYLVANYGTDADATWLLDHHEIHLVLQSNPDGRKHAETGSSWRKNTNENYCGPTSSSRGADLNRNYPFNWGGSGSSGFQCSSTYRGSSPTSEPETAAITNYVRTIFPDQRDESQGPGEPAPADATGVFLDIHSYSELVLWPWGDVSSAAPNGDALQTLGRRFAYFNGYEPQQSIELYPTDGTTLDWAYGELGVASYTFELGTTFFQSCSTFENTILPDNMDALLYAAKVARTPYLTPGGPDSLNVTLDQSSVPQGVSVQITATADDTRYNNSNGAEPNHPITSASVHIDTPPWEFGIGGIPMAAQDGSFDETVEGVTATIDTSTLAVGQHILFVDAQDSKGQTGPVSAVFLEVLPSGGNLPPSVTITGPADGTTVTEGTSVDLTGTASDPEDGDLTASISWSSNLDGNLGTGALVSATLSVGTHTITASVTDSSSAGASDSITVTVNPAGGGGDLLNENFDSGAAGWTTDGLWHLATNSSCTAPDNGWSSAPNAMYYGQDSSCNYDTGSATSGNLTSPSISGVTATTVLRFDYWRQVESYSGDYDNAYVQVSTGGSWTTVWSRNARDTSQSDWLTSSDISLAAYAGQTHPNPLPLRQQRSHRQQLHRLADRQCRGKRQLSQRRPVRPFACCRESRRIGPCSWKAHATAVRSNSRSPPATRTHTNCATAPFVARPAAAVGT